MRNGNLMYYVIGGVVILISSLFIWKALTGTTPTPTPITLSGMMVEVSYFSDRNECEYMLVKNKSQTQRVGYDLSNSHFQVVHMPTCTNVKHSK